MRTSERQLSALTWMTRAVMALVGAALLAPDPVIGQPLDWQLIDDGGLDWEYEWGGYHNGSALGQLLDRLVTEYPQHARKYSIGSSQEEQELWAVEISAHGLGDVDDGRPHILFIGNIHGNEAVGRELILRLAYHLLFTFANSTDDARVMRIIDGAHLHFLPCMNPDGFERAVEGNCQGRTGQNNSNNVDLDQNFPGRFNLSVRPVQAETQAVMSWLESVPFALSASFRGGQLVVAYPYSNSVSGQTGRAATPDDEEFAWLGRTYAAAHPAMHLGHANCWPVDNSSFAGGVVNTAEWRVVNGSMQNYNYDRANNLQVGVYLGCCRYPPQSNLRQLWEANRDAMLSLLTAVFQNAHGRVLTANGGVPDSVTIVVRTQNGTHATVPDGIGYFWRLLIAGSHILEFAAPGHQTVVRAVSVVADQSVDLGTVLLQATVTTPSTAPTSSSGANTVPKTSATRTTPPIATTVTSDVQPTPAPDSRQFGPGAIVGLVIGTLIVGGVAAIVLINLRKFSVKRRAYDKITTGHQSDQQRVVLFTDIPREHVGRLY